MVSCLIIGFGRMGISHSLLINAISKEKVNFTIVDKSFFNRLIARCVFPKSLIVSDIDAANHTYDYAVLGVPPSNQSNVYEKIKKNVTKILVEKPIRVDLRKQDLPGYVMIHNPVILKMRSILVKKKIKRLEIVLNTNVDFDIDLGGWRSGKDGNLKSEFFSHVASLAAFLASEHSINKEQFEFNIIEDSTNHFKCGIKLHGIDISLELLAKQNIRKANYHIHCITDNYTYTSDMYTIEQSSMLETPVVIANITQLSNNNFYLRGFEFSNQISFFLSGEEYIVDFVRINKLVQEWETRLA